MAKLTKDQIEEEAAAARRFFKVADQPQPDVVTLIFKAKHQGIIRNYRREDWGKRIGAEFDPKNRVIALSDAAFSGLNLLPPNPESREIGVHEIGHAWFGHQHHRSFTRLGDTLVKPVFFDEWQTTYFTGAFLIPPDFVNFHPGLSAADLAQQFNVPFRLARSRLKDLERLHERSSAVKRTIPDALTVFLNSDKQFLRRPCNSCGRPSVYRKGAKLICDSCGADN